MRLPLLVTVSLAACNPDTGLTLHDNNRPPEVAIVAPGAGERFLEGDDVVFTAQVTDDATALADLDLSWRTTNGGAVEGAQTVSDDTVTLVAVGLVAGDHTVSLTAVDSQGSDGRAEVALTVDANLPPTVTFIDPAPDGRYAFGVAVPVVVSIDDDWDAPTTVTLSWADAADLDGMPVAPDDAGEAQFTLPGLAIGSHRVTVTALDGLGATRTRSVDFEVVDPDTDGDGHVALDLGGDDCHDGLASVHPGADEVCDGEDNDCDGAEDDDPTNGTSWFFDDDLDGWGDPAVETIACAAPGAKWKAQSGDCADGDNARFPGNPEVCDAKDNDCAGGVDNGLTFAMYYTDGDGDTWGLVGSGASACAQPANTATRGGDCADGNGLVNPGRTETCNGVDDDCANGADDGLAIATYYFDDDLDGYGNSSVTQSACADPGGKWETVGGDCADNDDERFPTNPEVCDGKDNNCAGGVDNGLTFATYYTDGDGDTWGLIGSGVSACAQPLGSATRGGDCNDGNGNVNPGKTETCNGVDDNCADGADDGLAFVTYYFDDDLDGYGNSGVTQSACADPGGKWKAVGGDCADDDNTRFPTNPEVCDAKDNDCVGGPDNGLTFATYYTDGDGDTWGLIGSGASACAQPANTATRGGDCADGNGLVNPGKTEACNGIDDDCANGADDGLAVATYYFDDDLDGYGNSGVTQSACAAPGGKWRTVGGDCADNDNARFPTNPEVCDSKDNDCANGVDNGLTFTMYYTDGDGDTWGVGSGTSACAQPANTATRGGDCADGNGLVNPGRTETCNGVDDNCVGGADDGLAFETWYYDFDLDGYGDPTVTQSRCDVPTGRWVDAAGDCDDDDDDVNPLETEVCNGKDDDCEGGADDDDPGLDTSTASTWYFDDDGDSWGVAGNTTLNCTKPTDYAALPGDCADTVFLVNPGQDEVCDNGVDDDCLNGIDDACDVDYSGTWALYEPGTNNLRTVTYACDGWSFSFDSVIITDSWPDIEVKAVMTGSTATIRVNGCEPGIFEILCPTTDTEPGMPGVFDTATEWSAWDDIEPWMGSGYAEIYEWRDVSGAPLTWATFTDDTTFLSAFAWWFIDRNNPVPADCDAGFVEVEGRKL